MTQIALRAVRSNFNRIARRIAIQSGDSCDVMLALRGGLQTAMSVQRLSSLLVILLVTADVSIYAPPLAIERVWR